MRFGTLFLFLVSTAFVQAQSPFLQVLGVAQDGGYPHIGCEKSCCAPAWLDPTLKQPVVSLALTNPSTKQWWLFEATPDMKDQLHDFQKRTGGEYPYLPAGIFITHAHIGHYTGLMQLGREALGSKQIPVYVLERMGQFLKEHGPWSQLVSLNNITLITMKADQPVTLTTGIQVTAFTVPHRDEFSETAGFKIFTPAKKYLFIPDIDKWEKWSVAVEAAVAETDVALLDATFYSASELPNRAMSEIPHPLVEETMNRFDGKATLKQRIWFIHFNHTNPLLWDAAVRASVQKKGFQIAESGMIFK